MYFLPIVEYLEKVWLALDTGQPPLPPIYVKERAKTFFYMCSNVISIANYFRSSGPIGI